MKLRCAIAAWTVTFAAWGPAVAQPDVLTELYGSPNSDPDNVTLQSDVVPMFSEGRLMGCSVTFQVLQRDNVYRNGDWALLDGSVGLLYVKGKAIVGTIKLGLGVIDSNNSATRTAPAVVALIGDHSKTSAGEILTSEETQPGFRFFILDLSKTKQSAFIEALAIAQARERINGYYALTPDGLGSNFYVDMRVRHFQPSEPGTPQFANNAGFQLKTCMDELLNLADQDTK